MPLVTIIIIVLAALALLSLIIGLLYEPKMVAQIALAPFIILRVIIEEINQFVEQAQMMLKAFWDSHLSQVRAATLNTTNSRRTASSTASASEPISMTGAVGSAPRAEANDPDNSVAAWFVSRLIYLGVAVVLIVSAGALDIYRANAAQFGNADKSFSLPGFLASSALLNGFIWVTLIIFWGIITLDILGMTPRYARLLRMENKWIQGILSGLIILGDGLLILTVAALYYTASLSLQGQAWPDAANDISAAQGLLINGAGFLALLAIISGIVVFVLLADAILLAVLAVVHLITKSLASTCNVIGDSVARALAIETNVARSGWFTLTRRLEAPPFPRVYMTDEGAFADELDEQRTQSTVLRVQPIGRQPSRSSSVGAASAHFYPEPSQTVELGQTVLLAVGQNAIDLLWQTANDVDAFVKANPSLQGRRLVSAVGFSPWPSRGIPRRVKDWPLAGLRDVGPDKRRREEAYNLAGGDAGEALAVDLLRNAAAFCAGDRFTHGQILLYLNLEEIAYIPDDAMRELREALSEYMIGIVAISPRHRVSAQIVADALGKLNAWWGKQYITSTLLVDSKSPLSRSVNEDKQEELIGRTLASLICAPASDPENDALGAVFRYMGGVASFMACGSASAQVVSGSQVPGWSWLNTAFGLPRRGSGYVHDIRSKVLRLFTGLINDKQHRWTISYDHPVTADVPMVAINIIPMRLNDPRWKGERQLLNSILREHSSSDMQALFVNGNGVPVSRDKELPREYYAQVSVLTGVDGVKTNEKGELVGERTYGADAMNGYHTATAPYDLSDFSELKNEGARGHWNDGTPGDWDAE